MTRTTRPTGPTGATAPTHGAIRVREELRPGDLPALAALTTGTARPLTAQELTQLVLADPDPRSSIVLVVEDAENTGDTEEAAGRAGDPSPVGFAHVATQDGAAYLVSGAVHPAHRRRGVGTRLLDAALVHARRWGAESLVISGRPRGYAAPGIDEAADPGTAAFLRARGAHEAGSALAMERELTGPAERSPAGGAHPPDVRIAPCTPEEVPGMLAAVRLHLSEDWAQLLGAHVAHRAEEESRGHHPTDGPAGTILLARDATESAAEPVGELLGIAAWDVVGADPGRFGPIGVLPSARGRGVGGALLDAALVRMARAGARRAWFQWTWARGPAHRMYLSRGFRPLATTTPFELPVRPDAAPIPAVPIPAVPIPKERSRP
ncbi:GNAT family N-acetyltransferase [Brachybacterium sp. MASK1Z-5]|uniref:GNAT family N-acetyltransferase n=1 Tax=Brachybacterium halotolerans TaxID=2795215 RepID=A0ABS1BCB1_9MICO|nr:GNAT family N-acetyltransferase [Brachybacterium halotolerans]MBK0332234.1 GNAT family N-acetyltransferase [Brachybacterium halotolerans]